ncbi:ribosome-binding factor A [Thermoclostridium stercorarium subsp. thermolacticum DSM 2910]|nr:ribosome-binding factor A [Thermoclostridium stercorarium subsp. stercorarium DSM 8532]ANW98471.1 ribosome-binding factor A [Thermoclostridium stercorarium subsp. thermolacticum DSM 2910]ANX01004.1 ribosome-binding factor A [Thermoclostridium stercorarium subsp. leptospartum DSM 9219]
MMERTDRISVEIQKEVSDIIRNSIKDPRIPEMISVTRVEVTKDLRYAKVYISIYGSEEEKKNAMTALKGAAGFVRREIGQRIQLRYTPEIVFKEDNSIEQGLYISKLIDEIMHSEKE